MKKITPILQARMGSTRLPGKVLKPILGYSMLSHIIRRVKLAEGFEPPIVATSVNSEDDAVEAECSRLDVRCYRGSETDVLSRFYEAGAGCGHIMRICCDNPLLDPKLMSALAVFYRNNGYSYVVNSQVPLGLAAEIFSFFRLEEAHQNTDKPYHREHVTPYMYEDDIDCGRLVHEPDLSHLRFTVDTPEDFAVAAAIYEKLHKKNPAFGLEEILNGSDTVGQLNLCST